MQWKLLPKPVDKFLGWMRRQSSRSRGFSGSAGMTEANHLTTANKYLLIPIYDVAHQSHPSRLALGIEHQISPRSSEKHILPLHCFMLSSSRAPHLLTILWYYVSSYGITRPRVVTLSQRVTYLPFDQFWVIFEAIIRTSFVTHIQKKNP